MDTLQKITESLKSQINIVPEVGIIVSRGMGELIDSIENKITVGFNKVEGLKAIGSDKEKGKFYAGVLNGKNVLIMYGRLHDYKGYKEEESVLPIYAMKELGCKTLIINGVVGAVSGKLEVGDIVSVTDHINFSGRNPLYGHEYKPYGARFFDMTGAYSERLIKSAEEAAKELKIKIKRGVLGEFLGPTAETAAEVGMAKQLGCDCLGFHFVGEVIAARYAEMEVYVCALVTNYASAFSGNKLKYEDVQFNRQCASGYSSELMLEFLKRI